MEAAAGALMLQSALWYVRYGFYIFPIYEPIGSECSCGSLADHSKGKHPRTANGLNDATRDETVIREWWTKWPNASIGINCGLSGIFALDNDPKKSGLTTHADLKEHVERKYGEFPDSGESASRIMRQPLD
jgi:hypothetical protein